MPAHAPFGNVNPHAPFEPGGTPGPESITEPMLNEIIKRALLSNIPGGVEAPVEHTAASYELVPSATKYSFVAVRCVSKSATACKYNISVGANIWTEVVDPSITGSIDVTIIVPVPAGKKLKVEKVEGELEKSITVVMPQN